MTTRKAKGQAGAVEARVQFAGWIVDIAGLAAEQESPQAAVVVETSPAVVDIVYRFAIPCQRQGAEAGRIGWAGGPAESASASGSGRGQCGAMSLIGA